MSHYDIYTFVLCLIVFLALSGLLSFLLALLVHQAIRLIRHGCEDKALLEEYVKKCKEGQKKKLRFSDVLNTCFVLVVCVALLASFVFSVYIQATNSKAANGVPSLKVVKSASMSYADEKNTYLERNNITNQLQTFDLILTEHMPDEFELKLYDVVVYEQNGEMVIHRIVGIEEPNQKHPDVRYFLLQGDAVQYPDSFPVLYSQMRGIWTGFRIPFVGSFIMFMQSPAGWLCILLILTAFIVTPLVEKKFQKEKEARLRCLVNCKVSIPVSAHICANGKKPIKSIAFEHIKFSRFHMTIRLQPRSSGLDIRVHHTNHSFKIKNPEE